MGFIRKTGMREMLNQEVILFHLEQAYYGGYTTTDLRLACFHSTFYKGSTSKTSDIPKLGTPTSSDVCFEREKWEKTPLDVGSTRLGMSGFFGVLPLLLAAICCYVSLSVLK